MKILPLFLTVFVFACHPWASEAQTRTVTLDEAVQIGLDHSRQLKIAGTKLDIAKAKRTQFANALIPSVTYSGTYTRISDNVTPFTIAFPGSPPRELNPQILNQFTNRLSANQLVFTGLRTIHFYESAQLLEKAADLDIDRDRIEIKNNILSAFYILYKLVATQDILAKNRGLFTQRRTDVSNFVQQGLALDNDLLKADLALSQIELSQQEVDNNLTAARFNLNLTLGLPAETVLALDSLTFFAVNPPADLNTYLMAINNRPDVSATGLRQQASEKSVQVAKGGLFPTISIGANAYYNNPNQRVFPQEAQFKGTWDAGVSLNYNLTNLYTGGKVIDEAKANAVQIGLQKEQLLEAAQMEVNTTYFAWRTAQEKIKLTEKTIAQSIENQRVTNNRYQQQVATLSDLLEADFLLLQSRINASVAKADAQLAYFRLLKAVGQ